MTNPLSQDEDFFVPLREGVSARPAPSPEQVVEDLAYFQERLWAALKVPEEYRRTPCSKD